MLEDQRSVVPGSTRAGQTFRRGERSSGRRVEIERTMQIVALEVEHRILLPSKDGIDSRREERPLVLLYGGRARGEAGRTYIRRATNASRLQRR